VQYWLKGLNSRHLLNTGSITPVWLTGLLNSTAVPDAEWQTGLSNTGALMRHTECTLTRGNKVFLVKLTVHLRNKKPPKNAWNLKVYYRVHMNSPRSQSNWMPHY
jgi:hypothetical protein